MVEETHLKQPHSNVENWTENLQRLEKSMVNAISKIQQSHERDMHGQFNSDHQSK